METKRNPNAFTDFKFRRDALQGFFFFILLFFIHDSGFFLYLFVLSVCILKHLFICLFIYSFVWCFIFSWNLYLFYFSLILDINLLTYSLLQHALSLFWINQIFSDWKQLFVLIHLEDFYDYFVLSKCHIFISKRQI